jgi:osmotically-inducible protein OsmY
MSHLFRNIARTALFVALLSASWTSQAAFAEHDKAADWTTTAKVKLELLNKLGADALRMDVDTVDGKVRLSGTVDKRETVELADDIAKSVGGVHAVDNDLRHEPKASAAADKASAIAQEAEAEVKDAVLEAKLRLALIDKLGTDGFKVGTEAASGLVTLEFDRDLSSARRAEAERAARTVDGVKRVVTVDKKG